jgi:hypothetical protein
LAELNRKAQSLVEQQFAAGLKFASLALDEGEDARTLRRLPAVQEVNSGDVRRLEHTDRHSHLCRNFGLRELLRVRLTPLAHASANRLCKARPHAGK